MSQFLSQFQAWKYMIMTVVYSESATLDLAVPVDLAVNGGAVTYTHGSVVGGGGDKHTAPIPAADSNQKDGGPS